MAGRSVLDASVRIAILDNKDVHFAAAKQSQTRTARIEKCIPKILAGMGMNDR